MSDNKKIMVFTIFVAVIMAVVTVSTMSYAYFTLQVEEGNVFSTKGKALNDSLRITLTETQSGVTLDKTYPMPDANGLRLDPYTFTVTNEDTRDFTVDIFVEVLNTSTLSDELVNVGIDGQVKTLNSSIAATPSESTFKSSYNIYSFDLNHGEAKTSDLRTWINDQGTVDNAQNKTWSSRILVVPRLKA